VTPPSTGPKGPGLEVPAVILAADHRARGVITIERYQDYLAALRAALGHCDGILASAEPLRTLADAGDIAAGQRTYLSINRTGLAGSSFELDDRLVATIERAAADGWTGVKHMTRIDMRDPVTASALELLGRVLEAARVERLDALVEALVWRDGAVARDTDSIVFAAIVAHDLGAPLLKVPVPDEEPGAARVDAVARIVDSVGVPVLFLGGPRSSRLTMLDEVRDVMAGRAAGLAIGRALFQDPEPETAAKLVAEIVHGSGAVAPAPT
jgi:DhnA family fructose-bisphosphate aldolase class Ia